jgi:hypothetical protein
METAELNTRLMEEARCFEPQGYRPSRLTPHRNVILLYRAKGLSYERIAAAFVKHGLKISPPTVGLFCRQHIKETEVLRERRRLEVDVRQAEAAGGPIVPFAPAAGVTSGKRGPRIARDDF